MNRITIILAVIFCSCSASIAQRILSLDEAIAIALKESYSIKSAQFSLASSEKTLEAARLGLRTTINLDLDVPEYTRNLSSKYNFLTGKDEFYEIGYTKYESRLSFIQPIPFSNGTVSMAGSVFRRDQLNAGRDYYSNFMLSLNQPLFTFNTMKANLERSELNLQKTQRSYQKTEADIVYNVSAAFFDLFQSMKNLEITQEKVNQTSASFETAQNKLKAGLIAEVEAMQLEVDLASSKNDLLSAERRYRESQDNFKFLIGLQTNENFEIKGEIEFVPIEADENLAVEYAIKNRAELFNAEVDIRLSEMALEETDSKKAINAEINASYGINKNADQADGIFHNFADNRGVAFTVHVPVWDWGKNSREVEAADANLRLNKISYTNQRLYIQKEIRQLVNKIRSARARVEVLARSVEVAQKSYNISSERFKVGNITSFDLSQMQLRLTDAKTNSLDALIDYKLAVADLYRKTLFDFSKK